MIISNSTPLINFSAIRRLDILYWLFGSITIPPAVKNEVFVKGKHYLNTEELRRAAFIEIIKPKNMISCNLLKADLDDGEAEVITLGLEGNATLLLLDEITARAVAESHHLHFTGSIGCLVEAKKLGIISEIKPLLEAMRIEARFWINENLYKRILQNNKEL
jgi:predicted nucleic acid-binding protein